MIDINTPIPFLRPLELQPVEDNGHQYFILRDPSGISEKSIALSSEVIPVLASFNNMKTLTDIAQEISAEVNEEQDPNELIPFVELLDDLYFLQNERFENFRKIKVSEFAEAKLREPILAGSSYPLDKENLESFLEKLLLVDEPDDFEPERPDKNAVLKGYLAPHIDYERGGASYGRLYRELKPYFDRFKDRNPLFIIFGVAHAGAVSPITVTGKTFSTPLGEVQTNETFYTKLVSELGDKVVRDEWLHKNEHSIELQLIWLKHLMGGNEFTVLPTLVSMWDMDENIPLSENHFFQKTVETFKSIEELHDGPVIYVSSVDFAHVGPAFGDKDFIKDSDIAVVEKIDMEALKSVRSVDSDLWWKTVNYLENPNRICGLNATALSLELLKGCKGYILDYAHSLSEDRSLMVSYASSMFFDN